MKEWFIKFFPTYKFLRLKNNYEVGRIPSWTDRIMFKDNDNGLKLLNYEANFN